MREILFRGKRLDNGEWVEGDICHHDGVVSYIGQHPADGSMVCYDLATFTVGQYTGLLDKNGKRIFEGDILKDDWGKIFEVFFSTKTCSFMANLKIAPSEWETGNYRLGEAWTDTVKIVSNIHDNPELLEVTPDE